MTSSDCFNLISAMNNDSAIARKHRQNSTSLRSCRMLLKILTNLWLSLLEASFIISEKKLIIYHYQSGSARPECISKSKTSSFSNSTASGRTSLSGRLWCVALASILKETTFAQNYSSQTPSWVSHFSWSAPPLSDSRDIKLLIWDAIVPWHSSNLSNVSMTSGSVWRET